MVKKFRAAKNGFTVCDNRECISSDVYPLLEFCADLCVPWPDQHIKQICRITTSVTLLISLLCFLLN